MARIALVIPCYRCSKSILSVIAHVPSIVEKIFLIDDACPDKTGALVESKNTDSRVRVIYHTQNKGVGGAMITGYQCALNDGIDIVVKVDGDDQMDLNLLPRLVAPLESKLADYTKGNRFYRIRGLNEMPLIRVIGNSFLSFFTKASSGLWSVMDPTNGFTAIHRTALSTMRLDELDHRYFFESDMLYQLNLNRAVVWDVPTTSRYKDEISNLKIRTAIPTFFLKHLIRMVRRIFYEYIIRDFNIGSLQAVGGGILLLFGSIFGGYHWIMSHLSGITASSGTVMISGVSLILGFQLVLSALLYDITKTPKIPLQVIFSDREKSQSTPKVSLKKEPLAR